MTTENNPNNLNSNMSKTNTESISENTSKEVQAEFQSRLDEFSQPKKVFYLASCDDSMDILKKQQEQGLTDILLALKKEHDSIKMESKKIIEDTEKLEKKITMIQQMDTKTNKKNLDSKVENENIKKAIEATRERLKEEEYKKKTLQALLLKIKKDINLNEITLQKSYDKQNLLKQKLQKEKLLQNEIKAKGNQINSQISSQKKKNDHDENEYNLQVQYYNQIIKQKKDFIKAAEDRKQRQIKIAQDAKKMSGDKDENEKREKLEMLYLINNYLQKKMETQLEKNKDIEDAFSKIRLICGTNNLKNIINKVLLKDKKYNYTITQINQKEQEKKQLIKEIEELNKKFSDLRNEIVVDVDSVGKKDIQIIKSKDIEVTMNNENLVNEEAQLNEQYKLNKELNNLVTLRYDQVVNSLRKLCSDESLNYMRDVSLNASKMFNVNPSSTNTNLLNNDIKETKEDKENEEQQSQEEKKEEKKENEETKEEVKEGEENLKNENDKEIISRNKINENTNQEMRIVDNAQNNNNNIVNNIDITNEENRNNNIGMINNSSTVNINMSGIGSMSVLDQDEEAKLIKSYKEYLNQAEKTIDALFLMKTKNDFLQMVRDKASEFDEANKTLKIIKKVQDGNKKSRASISKSVALKEEKYSEYEYGVDENESAKERELQEKIFRTYMIAERRKMERFINNEKEGKEGKFIKKSN